MTKTTTKATKVERVIKKEVTNAVPEKNDYVTIDFGRMPVGVAIIISTFIFTAGIGLAIYFGLKARPIVTSNDTISTVAPTPTPLVLTQNEFKEIDNASNSLPSVGSGQSGVVFIEFGDYSCTYCQKFFKDSLSLIRKEYIDTNKIKMLYVDYPRTQVYSTLQEYSICVGKLYGNTKFFGFHDDAYNNFSKYYPTATLDTKIIAVFAAKNGMSFAKLDECAKSQETKAQIGEYGKLLSNLGEQSTPAFFIGKLDSNGKVKSGEMLIGAQPFSVFRSILDSYIAK